MKVELSKYPLLDHATRRAGLNDEFFRLSLYNKLATSTFEADRGYFSEYRSFIDYLADTPQLKAYLIAETVSGYLFKHAEPIMEKLWKFIPDIPDQTGVILWRDWTYFFKKFDDGEQSVVMYMICHGIQGEVGLVIKDKDDKTRVRGNPPEESRAKAMGFLMSTLILPFLEFAECETKIINSKHARRTVVGKDKYVTDIPLNIKVVDSNWFTTIVRSEGFNVSGHFRLQPVGAERSQRKLVWIKDFEKHGYTKRARIEIEREEDL
jgi:hypothetical protein